MTPIGRFSVASESEWNPSITTLFLSFSGKPLTAQDLNKVWEERKMPENHPRFCMAVNEQLRFQPEPSNVEHITDTVYPANKEELKNRIVHMQMDRWDLKDSLWYMHIASSQKDNETLLLFRGHHALADGASLGATLSDLLDERDELRAYAEDQKQKFLRRRRGKKSRNVLDRFWRYWVRFVKMLFGLCFAVLYHLSLVLRNAVWDSDPWQALMDPSRRQRSVAWTKFAPMDQIKAVASAFGDRVTINDVMVFCVSAALRRQLKYHTKLHDDLPEPTVMHIAMPVHLGGTTGNNIGAMVARFGYGCDLEAVHQQLSFLKGTPMALLSYGAARLFSSIAPASWFSASNAGSIAVVSNNRGPPQQVHLLGRTLEQSVGFVPLPPGIPIGVTIQSYAGDVNCTLCAEEWAVPDTDQFLVWMMEEYKGLAAEARDRMKTKQQ